MYEVIEHLSESEPVEVDLHGQSVLLPSVVEDEDGIRLLVVPESRVHEEVWRRAHADHQVAAIIVADPPVYAWMSEADFIETRSTSRGHYVTHSNAWRSLPGPLSYRELLQTGEQEEPVDAPPSDRFVSLHTHSEFSAFDGLSTPGELADIVSSYGQKALALSDHGTCAGHPLLQKEADRVGIKPIFGIEAYFVDDRHFRPDKGEKDRYYHLCLWAMDDEGLRNIWAMSTEGYREGFYRYPRIDWDTLQRFNKGVMASTTCLGGVVPQHIMEGEYERARMKMGRFLDIFEDRFYVELHTNGLEEQVKVNKALVKLADELEVPVIASSDSHYSDPDDKADHKVWMAMQTNSDLQDETGLFEGDTSYGLLTEEAVAKRLDHLDPDVVEQAIINTGVVADRCTARIPVSSAVPVYSAKGGHERDVERLIDVCIEGWERKLSHLTAEQFPVYAERFEKEMNLLIDKRFAGYFLMVWDYAKRAKDLGILVGPGRGSGGGSLVAYLCDIIEIEPIEADLMFERFLTPGRDSLPDFDLDFPPSKRDLLQDELRGRWGDDHVVRIGTHLRFKNKGIVRKLASTLASTQDIFFPDIDKVSAIIDAAEADTAGLGMQWEDLWEDHADLTHAEVSSRSGGDESFTLASARERYPELFGYADAFVGRLNAYGKHAAGFVISTDTNLIESLPLRTDDDGNLITQYDMDALESMGYIKFDLLTIRTLDTIQQTIDLIEERHGIRVNPYDKALLPLDDAKTWEDLSGGHVLGVFQVEKVAGQRMCKRLKPESIADLAAVITLIRPGPSRSGLTEMYLNRRDGAERVTYPHPSLEPVLNRTYGCMIYQEDIMATCQTIAGYDLGEADEVRRILGKKKVELVISEGERFLERATERGIEKATAENLWEQMGEFAKYGFNRAHAWGYALLGYYCAWLKVNYPVEFFTAVLSTVDKERIPEFVREARRLGIEVHPPDINESGAGFSASGEVVRYGFDAIKGIGDAATRSLIAAQPYSSWEDFREKSSAKESAVNIGHIQLLVSAGAFDSLYPNRKALELLIEREKSGEAEKCVFKDLDHRGPNDLPCHFDWDSEPAPIGKTGRELKKKPIPRRCTKACRNYTAPPPLEPEDVEPYTTVGIREREREMLGVYLTSTPFDDVPQPVWEEFNVIDGEDLEHAARGEHVVVGLLTKRKPHEDRNSNKMGFLGFELRDGEIVDVVAFHKTWGLYSKALKVDSLYAAIINKDSGGYQLKSLVPL